MGSTSFTCAVILAAFSRTGRNSVAVSETASTLAVARSRSTAAAWPRAVTSDSACSETSVSRSTRASRSPRVRATSTSSSRRVSPIAASAAVRVSLPCSRICRSTAAGSTAMTAVVWRTSRMRDVTNPTREASRAHQIAILSLFMPAPWRALHGWPGPRCSAPRCASRAGRTANPWRRCVLCLTRGCGRSCPVGTEPRPLDKARRA